MQALIARQTISFYDCGVDNIRISPLKEILLDEVEVTFYSPSELSITGQMIRFNFNEESCPATEELEEKYRPESFYMKRSFFRKKQQKYLRSGWIRYKETEFVRMALKVEVINDNTSDGRILKRLNRLFAGGDDE